MGPYSSYKNHDAAAASQGTMAACYLILILVLALGMGLLMHMSRSHHPVPEINDMARHRNAGF